jgi:hypothetical protein
MHVAKGMAPGRAAHRQASLIGHWAGEIDWDQPGHSAYDRTHDEL